MISLYHILCVFSIGITIFYAILKAGDIPVEVVALVFAQFPSEYTEKKLYVEYE